MVDFKYTFIESLAYLSLPAWLKVLPTEPTCNRYSSDFLFHLSHMVNLHVCLRVNDVGLCYC